MVDLMKKIKGSYTIAFTPFHEDGSIDYEQFEKQVDYLFSYFSIKGPIKYFIAYYDII